MKRFFSDIRVQKLFLPLAFLLIFSVWCADRWGDPYNPLCYGALILGVLFFYPGQTTQTQNAGKAGQECWPSAAGCY